MANAGQMKHVTIMGVPKPLSSKGICLWQGEDIWGLYVHLQNGCGEDQYKNENMSVVGL